MKTTILRYLLILVIFSPALGAQTAGKTAASGAQAPSPAADLTGVWYPSVERIRPAYTKPLISGQRYVWLDLQGQPLKEMPLTAWGQQKQKDDRGLDEQTNALQSNDPSLSCYPPGIPRIYLYAYPIEFINTPGRMVELFEFGHNMRQIFTDGRGHDKDGPATWMGDSIGKWEGDTLVVETVNQRPEGWLGDDGTPHSEDMVVVERFHRTDANTLMIDITVTDPKTYSIPLHTNKKFILKPKWNLSEFVCEDTQAGFSAFEKKVGEIDNNKK